MVRSSVFRRRLPAARIRHRDPRAVGPAAHVSRLGIAVFGAVSIIGGTAVAMATVPEEVEPAGALFWPAASLTIALLLPVALQLRKDLTAVLRVENVLLLGLVYWLLLDMLQSAYPFEYVTQANVQAAFGLVGAFALTVWLGASGRGWALPAVIARTASRPVHGDTLFRAMLIAFALGMAKFIIGSGFDPVVMIEGLGANRWAAPWARGDFGGADAILDHFQYFGYIVPSLCVLLAMRFGWSDRRVLLGLILSVVILAFLAQGGGRRIIGVVVGAALFTWVASRPRLGPGMILGGAGAVALLLLLMQEILRYRGTGFSAWWAGEQPELRVSHLHVDDNFLRLSQLTRFYPEVENFLYHQPILHALTLPIPRLLWPGKPLGSGLDLPALLGMQGVSLSTSIVGELYVSFGLVAVLAGGFVIGRLAGMWNKILLLPGGASRPLMYGLGLMALFAGLRSMQALVQMSYIVLAWLVVAAILARSTPAGGAAVSTHRQNRR